MDPSWVKKEIIFNFIMYDFGARYSVGKFVWSSHDPLIHEQFLPIDDISAREKWWLTNKHILERFPQIQWELSQICFPTTVMVWCSLLDSNFAAMMFSFCTLYMTLRLSNLSKSPTKSIKMVLLEYDLWVAVKHGEGPQVATNAMYEAMNHPNCGSPRPVKEYSLGIVDYKSVLKQ